MAMEVRWRGMIRKVTATAAAAATTATAAAPLPTIPPPLFRQHHRRCYYYSRGVILAGRATTETFHQCWHHRRRCCCYHLARPPLLQIPRPSQAQPPSSTTLEYTPLLLLLHMHSPRWLSFKPSNAKAKAKTPPTADGTRDEQAWSDDDAWEEEEEKEPQIGDGGDGGGIVLEDVAWGQQVLSIANEILHAHFQDSSGGLRLFAFRVTHKGYIYVRLDKLSHKYGCPSIDEIEHFHRLYDKHLEESGERGEIPNNLAIEVSSPGVERLLRIPDDLERFKDLPLVLKYLEEDVETKIMHKKEGVFFVASIDNETNQCVWKLADVEDRDPLLRKGRRLSREKKEWRLDLPFQNVKSVTFYV